MNEQSLGIIEKELEKFFKVMEAKKINPGLLDEYLVLFSLSFLYRFLDEKDGDEHVQKLIKRAKTWGHK